MSRPLVVAALALLTALPVGAQVCPNSTDTFWKNDGLPDVPTGSQSIAIIPGLCEGEAIGTVFLKPAGTLPQKLNQVSVGFAHTSGGPGFQATCNVEIYEGSVTFSGSAATLGTKVFDLNQSQGASVQVSSSGVNTVDLSNYNVVVNDDFVVAFRMNINPNGNCAAGYSANFFTDSGGCTPRVNLIDELSGGWIDPATATIAGFPLCPLFYTGNWVIRACSENSGTAASWVVRNGSGINPAGFASLTNPVIGSNWITTVDIGTPGAFASAVAVVGSGPLQVPTGLGELLIDITAPLLGGGPNIAAGAHSLPIPNDVSLIGASLWTQAATIKPGPIIQLNNAIDLTLGL